MGSVMTCPALQFFEELVSEAPEKPTEVEVKDTQKKQVSVCALTAQLGFSPAPQN